MSERLLRTYLAELMLTELSVDRSFIAHLKRSSGLGATAPDSDAPESSIAEEWIDTLQDELGSRLHPGHRAQVMRFVSQRMPGLITRYNGNVPAAEQTMYNLLNTRFNSLRTGET